jgi:ribosomal protein L29
MKNQMTGAEVRALKDEEIGIELERLRAKLVTLRTQTVTEKVEDNTQFGKTRRGIAQLLTERNSRRHAGGGTRTKARA